MKRLVIRHGHTGVTRDQRDAFGAEGPPLDELGQKQAVELRDALIKLRVDPDTETVAVSEFLRTKQTAKLAGFQHIHASPLLNEIFTGMPGSELKAMIEFRQLPPIVLQKAQAILSNPPKENIWITHGLVIMGLREELGLKGDPFDPLHCRILELDV